MKMKTLLGIPVILMLLVSAVFTTTSCATTSFAQDPLDLVSELDLQRYLGQWYEVARYQHAFEKSLVGATAEYFLRDDGQIQVLNSGFRNTLDGKYTSVKAVAWRPDDSIPGALKVKFFGLFTSDYLVFGLDEVDYQWALVGNNSRDFIWFLSRTPEVSLQLLDHMRDIAIEQGYDLSELYLVPQKSR